MKKNIKKRPTFKGRGPNALWFLLIIIALGFAYLFWYNNINHDRASIPFSYFLSQVEEGNVKGVVISDQHVQGEFQKAITIQQDNRLKSIKNFETTIVSADTLWKTLHAHKVHIDVYPQDRQNWGIYLLLFLAPLLLLGFYVLMRQSQGGSGKIFTVGKSKAKFFSPNQIKIKFKDVAGVLEAKEDLKDIVDFLKNPDKFRRLGAKVPRGILLTGAPGNGKTMLAKAVAGEANCPFFSVSGSDFVEVFVGVGASRVRDLFVQARRHAPSIVFIDEIDAVGRHRGVGIGGGNDEREQTLNQLLSELDGFSTEPGEVIVLAATNRPDVLDKALLRPGRFDRKVEVPYPDLVSREQILKIHAKDVCLAEEVNLRKIARGTARFSGADLASLVNEAALLASKTNKNNIDLNDFEIARDKILVGAERKTLSRSAADMEKTAYHEAGHTLAIVLQPDSQPLHKVTILSRGGALGITWYLPEGDEISKSEKQIQAEIQVCLAGRIAEEIVYGVDNRTTGAYSDLKSATKIARDMVCLYGMSELGPITLEHPQRSHVEYSEATAKKIDAQVAKIISECYNKTKKLISENREQLNTLANSLVERETLDASEVYKLLNIPPKITHSFLIKKKDESGSVENEEKPERVQNKS